MQNLINNSINGLNKDEIIKQPQLKIQKRKREFELKQSVEEKIQLLQINLDQLKYRIEKLNTKVKKQDETIKNQGEIIKKQGETIKTHGEIIKTHGEIIKKQDETIKNQGEIIKKQGETIKTHGEIIKKQDETIKNHGEIIKKQGETIKNHGEIIKNHGEIIKNHGEIIKTQGDKLEKQGADIEQLKKQIDALMAHNNNLKERIDSDRINAIQDAALIGEQVNLVTVCQYYLEHCVLKEINEDKEEKDKISWDTFKCNYTRNNEAKKIAKGVELDKVLELCRDRNMGVHVKDEDEIKKIINNIKIVYRALPTSDAKFRPYKKSLLRICRFITDDEEFNLN